MQEEQNIQTSLHDSVLHYAALSKQAGLDGVVCSVLEAASIKNEFGHEFLRVAPGIRLNEGQGHDQIRIATPEVARLEGSSLIVVGRAITQSNHAVETYHLVKQQWEGY